MKKYSSQTFVSQRKKDKRNALDKLEIVPEKPEEKGNSAYMRRKLDAVLTEGRCGLPYPSPSENLIDGK